MSRAATAVLLLVAACGGSPPPAAAPHGYKWDDNSMLSNFMKKKFNDPFSKLSFFLFQTEETDIEALRATAGALLQGTTEISAWPTPPGDSPQAKQVFYEYAAAMKADATQLVTALDAQDLAAARQRFEKVREKCDSCHHFFRFGQ